jgi:hypothetical protein
MPKTETAAYSTERQKLTTSPVLFVRFSHVKKAGDGTDYPFSRDFSTASVTGSTKEKFLALRRISGNVQTVDPLQGHSSFGSFAVELLDLQGEIGKHMGNPQRGLATALSGVGGEPEVVANGDVSGYPAKGTIEIDSERIRYTGLDTVNNKFTGITRAVDGTSLAAHSIGTTIHNGEQIRPGQRCQIFAGYAPLNETDYRSETKMEVVDSSLADDWVTFVVQIADIQRFLKKQVFTGATRDAPVTLTGNPVTLALQILTSTGAGTNGAYDVLAAANGLAVPQALVDIAGLESLRDAEFAGQVYDFKLAGTEDGKTFIEREFWRTLNCVPSLKQDGKYSAKRLKPAPDPGTVTFTLTEDDIISWRWRGGGRLIVNQADFRYDWNLTDNPDSWGKRQLYTSGKNNGGSYDRYGAKPAIVIESKGIKTASGGQTILDDRAAQLFKRFADPPPILELHCFYGKNNAELGDYVKITHSKIYNHRAGLRGLTAEVFEVVDLRPQFGSEGRVILTCLHTGAITLPAAPTSGGAVITPNPERDTTAPAVPTGLAVTASAEIAGDGTYVGILDVTWTANTESDLSHYIVRHRKQGTAAWQDTFAGKLASPRQILRGMQPNTIYEIQVAAVDSSNNASAFSSTVTATTSADPGAPSTPTGLTATAIISVIRLAWNANPESDIDGFKIERADNATFTSGVITLDALRKAVFLLDGEFTPDTTKYYRVSAVRRTGATSAPSSVVSATAPGISGTAVRTDQLLVTQAAQIQSLIVQTGHVADLSVTNLKVAELTLGTSKHQADAITQVSSGKNDGTVSIITATPNWGDVVSVTVNTNAGDVVLLIQFEFELVTDPGLAMTGRWRVVRDSTALTPVVERVTGADVVFLEMFSPLEHDIPASGIYTYKLQGQTGGSGTINFKKIRLIPLVRKK